MTLQSQENVNFMKVSSNDGERLGKISSERVQGREQIFKLSLLNF
jgi:hypothetical protein